MGSRDKGAERSSVRSLRRRVLGFLGTMASHIAMAVGVGCAVFRWGLVPTLLIAFFLAGVGAAIAVKVWGPEHRGFRAVLRCGLVVGFAIIAVLGAVAVLGLLGCLLALPFLGRQPLVNAVVKSYWRDRFGGPPQRDTGFGAGPSERLETMRPSSVPAGLDLLDDAALCRTWRQSFIHMGSAVSVGAWLEIVEHRRRCLDELERRSPDGFAAWLASGARAAGDPLPFMRHPLPPAS